MTAERIFQIAAVVLAGTAAYFLWAGNTDAMFAAAVVGSCCFFISIRFQIRERQKARKGEYEQEDNSEDIETTGDETPDRKDI